MDIIEIKNLRKSYDDLAAVNDISFSIRPGEILGLLGPNGAGKTTTINMILGILMPTSGSIEIDGVNIGENSLDYKKNMNFAAVYAHLPSNLSVWQNLYIIGKIYEVKDLKKKIDTLLQEFDLKDFRKERSGILSSGEQSRLSLAKAVINDPKLLLLDEPTASLDPSGAEYMRQRIKDYAHKNEAAVLLTSHNMTEIERVCDRVLFLSKGRILLEGRPEELPKRHGKKDLEELFISIAREPLAAKETI
ncbi:MAG: ABC transporter ATP-binding protein [Calditrichaceae bacterium]|nr:ABC transporter ATP-binding protein [Calditrichaceae bacterium]